MLLISEDGAGGVSPHGYHKIAAGLKCEKQYQYGLRGVQAPFTQVPAYFTRGSLVHAGRACWLSNRGRPPEGSVEAAMLEALEKEREEAKKQGHTVDDEAYPQALGDMKGYQQHYSMLPVPKTVATEKYVEAVVDGVILSARLDDISFYPEAGNVLCIGECKTTSGSIVDTVNEYTLHPQVLLQQYLYRECLSPVYGEIKHTVLDVVKKGYKGKNPDYGRHVLTWNHKLIDAAAKWLASEKKRLMQIRPESQNVERNYSACATRKADRTYACPYRDLCLEGPDARLRYINAEGNVLTWEWE